MPDLLDEMTAADLAREFANLPRLSKKQQAFVDHYFMTNSPREAVIKAGYSKRTAYKQAYKLLSDPKVSMAIELNQKAITLRNHIDQDYFVTHLKKVVEAKLTKNSDKIAALSLLARITGFIKERAPDAKQLVVFHQEYPDDTKKKETVEL